MSEIVQIPVIRRNGVDIIQNVDIIGLGDSDLQNLAKATKGVVVYRKVRATYTEVEGTQFCCHYKCYKLGIDGTDDCGQHTQGK